MSVATEPGRPSVATTSAGAGAYAGNSQHDRRRDERRRGGRRKSDRQGGERGIDISELYCQFFPKVFAYVYSRVRDQEVSRDITSDVFEKAVSNIAALRAPGSFGPWLFTIVRNEVNCYFRNRMRTDELIQRAALEAELHGEVCGPEEALLSRERLRVLSQFIEQLSSREREVIALRFQADLTSKEIAAVLGTTELNVRVTMCRALSKLRSRIKSRAGFKRVAARQAGPRHLPTPSEQLLMPA